MPTEDAGSKRGLFSRLPFAVQLGIAIMCAAYGVASLTDVIAYQIPSNVLAVMYFAVAAYLFVRAARLSRLS
jgi:hypothetical protein